MSRKRYATLDGMRGMAALLVAYGHSWGLAGDNTDVYSNLRFGGLCVDLFFVLSGFVISYQYDGRFESGLSTAEFLKRRVVRLYPLYAFAFLLGLIPFIWDAVRGRASVLVIAIQFATGALLLPSPTAADNPSLIPILSPAWSLFAELWVANLTYALFWKWLRGPRLIAVVAVSAIALVLTDAYYSSIDVGALWSRFPGLFPRVCFSFYVGVMVQRLHVTHSWPRVPSTFTLLILVLVATPDALLGFRPDPEGLVANIYLLFCVLLLNPVLIYLGAYARERDPRVGVALGETSYALYVIHIPILLMLQREVVRFQIPHSQALAFAFVAICTLLAYWLQRYADMPARAILGRWLLRRDRPSPATAL